MKNVNVKKIVNQLASQVNSPPNSAYQRVKDQTNNSFVIEFDSGIHVDKSSKGKKFKVTVEEIKGKTGWTKAKDVKNGMKVLFNGAPCKILSTKSAQGDEVVVVEYMLDGGVDTANVSDLEKA